MSSRTRALWAQTEQSEYVESPTNTYWVTCGKDPPYHSRTATSPPLVSPDKLKRAFARVAATTTGLNSCSSESKLFFRGPHDRSFRVIYLIPSTVSEGMNGLRLVDWSPDSQYLVFETIRWQEGTDSGVDTDVVSYDSNSGVFGTLIWDVFFGNDKRDCRRNLRALGFSPEGKLVVRATTAPYYDPGDDHPQPLERPRHTRPATVQNVRFDDRGLDSLNHCPTRPRAARGRAFGALNDTQTQGKRNFSR